MSTASQSTTSGVGLPAPGVSYRLRRLRAGGVAPLPWRMFRSFSACRWPVRRFSACNPVSVILSRFSLLQGGHSTREIVVGVTSAVRTRADVVNFQHAGVEVVIPSATLTERANVHKQPPVLRPGRGVSPFLLACQSECGAPASQVHRRPSAWAALFRSEYLRR